MQNVIVITIAYLKVGVFPPYTVEKFYLDMGTSHVAEQS